MTHGGMTRAARRRTSCAPRCRRLLDDPTRGGVPGGAVTFAAMTSLRHLPYRFVCVLGLNDGAFPSTQRPVEFDLMARDPRRGDRQRRVDERNVFLDLLLAARERLYLSYTGRSVRDNSPIPPSVLVAELLDYAAAAIEAAPFSPASLQAARERLIVAHPLQPFSLDYFEPDADPRRRSFNDEYCDVAEAAADRASAPPAPAPRPLPRRARRRTRRRRPTSTTTRTTRGKPQETFFHAPARRGGPGVPRGHARQPRPLLPQSVPLPAQRAPRHRAAGRRRGAAGRRALRPRLCRHATRSPSACCRVSSTANRSPTSRGVCPRGHRVSDGAPRRSRTGAGAAAARAVSPASSRPRWPSRASTPVSATLDFTLDGERGASPAASATCAAAGLIRYRYDDARAYDYLNGWIAHLFLNAMAPSGVALRTTWHSRDGRYVLPPARGCARAARALLGSIATGCTVRCISSRNPRGRYVVDEQSLAKAARHVAEHEPPSLRRRPRPGLPPGAARRRPPLDDEFIACATAVFEPLLAVIEDERLAGAAA